MSTPLRWAGQYQDQTGLYYMQARYYDPQTAQFLTSDPLAPLTGQPYSYANDNPNTFADPTGLWLGISWLPSPGQAASWVGNGISSGATLVANHPGQAAEALAGGVCIVASDGVCAWAVAGAFGASTFVNTQTPDFWGHEAVTVGETGLLGGAGLIKTGLGAAGVFETTLADGTTISPALPESFLGKAGINAALTWPTLVGIGLEGPIDQAIFGGG
ncbi:MAG: RHS repeat-associated core domain-containing protein [Actinomycetota bacterium]|nr:RHS repeat-associated core domain-containing protein [Actinomycetota bacterium]